MVASDLREWVALFLMDLVSDGQGGAVRACRRVWWRICRRR